MNIAILVFGIFEIEKKLAKLKNKNSNPKR